MARYTGPKYKRERRLGVTIGLKGKASKRVEIPPGQHGRRGRRKVTDFGIRLTEKQKLKWTYDVSERQLKNHYQKAIISKENSGEKLLQLLEQRLDNIVFRLGLAPTRAAARQLVSHRHVQINGKRVNIPSYSIKPGEVVTLDKKGLAIPEIKTSLGEKKELPKWLKRQGPAGQIVTLPTRDQIPLDIKEQLIIEFYSR